jgi:DMSO reductase family type II enzyme chaperone
MVTTKSETELALARADVYRFLSMAFVYPDKDKLTTLHELASDMDSSISLLPYDMKEEYLAFTNLIETVDVTALQPDFTEMFLTRMFCPLTETTYGKNSFNQPNILGDISGFYKAFGFVMNDDAGVAFDHVTVELEFMSFLELKIAYALDQAMEENIDICLSAERRFLEQHIGKWTGVFGENLAARANEAYYRNLGLLLSKFMGSELKFFGIEVDSRIKELPKSDYEGPVDCPQQTGTEMDEPLPLH